MNATFDRLIEAARDLIENGGSVVRRNALQDALEKVRFETKMPAVIEKQWKFTPASKWVIARAAKIASDEQDDWIRISHIEKALKQLPPTA